MAETLPTHFLDLVANALLHSFWRKAALRAFLRRMNLKDAFLSTWHESETKRDFIYRMFPFLERSEAGRRALQRIANELAAQTSFPDLEGWEDSAEKKKRGVEAVRALKSYLSLQRENTLNEKEQAAARQRAQQMRDERIRRTSNLDALRARLDALASRVGTSEAGYEFQDWFYDLVDHFEVICRRPYSTAGRQIDGSVTVEGTTYLVELKFTSAQAGAPDVDIFYKKVSDKADNTMGLMVSLSGYSSVAIDGASVARSPLLLLDFSHLYLLLSGTTTLSELIARVRRHSSQTSRAFLPVVEM
ncbi:MAG: hypothetical protein IT355_16455 [Gemmatimonadaceae bacterium]|nr:hypothetical protein [Gemmatimonadaceae bacterium]